MTRTDELQAVSAAIEAAVAAKLYTGRLSPEEIERAAVNADVRALATDVRLHIGPDAARDPWSFFAWGRPRGYARNLILIYSRACELVGLVPSQAAQ